MLNDFKEATQDVLCQVLAFIMFWFMQRILCMPDVRYIRTVYSLAEKRRYKANIQRYET
jgi:hypothetical protein